MQCTGAWFSGSLGSARLTVGLDNLRGFFQPKWLCESVIPWSSVWQQSFILLCTWSTTLLANWLQQHSKTNLQSWQCQAWSLHPQQDRIPLSAPERKEASQSQAQWGNGLCCISFTRGMEPGRQPRRCAYRLCSAWSPLWDSSHP